MAMSRDLDAVGRDGVVNELVVLRRELVETLLDDVVAVKVLDEDDDVQAEGDDDGVNLKVRREVSLRCPPVSLFREATEDDDTCLPAS